MSMIVRCHLSLLLILGCVGGMSISFASFRLAYVSQEYVFVSAGLLLLGASLGTLAGRIFTGTNHGTIDGAIGGALGCPGAGIGAFVGFLVCYPFAGTPSVVVYHTILGACTVAGFLTPLIIVLVHRQHHPKS